MSRPLTLPNWAADWQPTGTFFDGVTSRPQQATLRLTQGAAGVALEIQTPKQLWRVPISALVIDPPLRTVPRLLRFAGRGIQGVGVGATPLGSGARFECADAGAAAQLERWLGRNRVSRLALALERQWGSVALSLAALLGFGYGFVQVGLPLVARQAAYLTPPSVLTRFDNQTVQYLAHSDILSPSHLSAKRQQQIRQRFDALVRERGQGYHYRLLFRQGGQMKANAFALPGGTVFITDELIALARQPIDIDAVLAHEISHVTHRDALTQIYQAVGIGLLAGAITGDLVGPSTVLAGVPTALLKSNYSRQMEAVADYNAGEYLLQHVGTTLPMRQMLQRLGKQDGGQQDGGQVDGKQSSGTKPQTQSKSKPKPQPQPDKGPQKGDGKASEAADILERWLGDHPMIEQRVADLLAQEQQWKKERGKAQP